MKLSEDTKKYAESIYRKAFHQAAVDGEIERRKIRATATFSNPNIPQMSEHFISMAKRLMTAMIHSYVQAYKQDDLLIDDEDKDKIIEELKRIMNNHIRWVTTDSTIREFRLPNTGELIPNMESYMTSRFERVLGEAAIDLDFARNEMVLERKNRKPEMPITHYNIYVHGHNYGNIQQNGENNKQTINPKESK
jgi:hypothetical protein